MYARFTIEDLDSSQIRVRCEKHLAKKNFQITLLSKCREENSCLPIDKKRWDGQIKLYNLYSQKIYAGLEAYIHKFCEDRNYSLEVPNRGSPSPVTEKYLETFLESIKISIGGKRVDPHEHQKEAILHAMNKNRCLMLSPTGSGKSLVIYTLLRHYLNLLPKDQKVLIIVPTIGLVSQMFSDIRDYAGMDSNWNPVENCHIMYAGKEKKYKKESRDINMAIITQNAKRILSAIWNSFWRRSTLVQIEVAEFNYDSTHTVSLSDCDDGNTRRDVDSQTCD